MNLEIILIASKLRLMSEMHNKPWSREGKKVSNKGVTPTVEESSRRVTPEPMPESPSQPKHYDEIKGHHGVIAPEATGTRKPEINRPGFKDGEATVAEHYVDDEQDR